MTDRYRSQTGHLFGTLIFCLAIIILPAALFAAKPNIVVFLCDDLGYGDVSCCNPESKIITPNIDSLAKGGLRFTAGHSPDAICTPTRYGTLTGRYSWRTRLKKGVLNGYEPPLIERNRMTIASMLKNNGYATGLVGKWHLGLQFARVDQKKPQVKANAGGRPERSAVNINFRKPLLFGPKDHGFDFSFHTPSGADGPPAFFIENGAIENTDIVWQAAFTGYASRGYKTDSALPRFIREAEGFITSHVAENPDQPFYLHITPTAPHLPWVPTREFKDRIKSQIGKEWDYGAFVLQVDWMLGRIMHVLDSLNIADSTLIVFSSDNGPEITTCQFVSQYGHNSNGDLRGYKRDTWEGGVRVPFIARWPGKIPEGTTNDEVVCLTDLMATFAAIVGYRLPDTAGEDSYSILPLLLGKETTGPVKEATMAHSGGNGYAIIKNHWSYIDGKGSNKGNNYPTTRYGTLSLSVCTPLTQDLKILASEPAGQLYDLASDHRQQNNLYDAQPDTVSELKALLQKYKSEGRSTPRTRDYAFFEELFTSPVKVPDAGTSGHSHVKLTLRGSSITVQNVPEFTISVFDLRGGLVASAAGRAGSPISLPDVKAGAYLVTINSKAVTCSQKLFFINR